MGVEKLGGRIGIRFRIARPCLLFIKWAESLCCFLV